MHKRLGYYLMAFVFVLSLVVLLRNAPQRGVRAQGQNEVYFPLAFRPEPIRFDDFEDEDPVWEIMRREETRDGFFEHLYGRLVAHIRDNSARTVVSPGWRPLGDFKLEVDARFASDEWQNGLGLAFSGNDTWSDYYAFALSFNFSQPWWAVVAYQNDVQIDLSGGYNGAPSFVRSGYQWNHLMIIRQQNQIRVYCNDRKMPEGTYTDSRYGTNRLVGLTVTSYEWDRGEVEFDNFKLTPMSMPY